MFERVRVSKLNPLDSRDFRSNEWSKETPVPATTAKMGDNGVQYYVGVDDYVILDNMLVIIADGAVSAGMVYYHQTEFTTLSHSYPIRLQNNIAKGKLEYLYLASVLKKILYSTYSRE